MAGAARLRMLCRGPFDRPGANVASCQADAHCLLCTSLLLNIQITCIEASLLLESTSELIGVKSDAIEHARRTGAGASIGARLAHHRRELAELTRLAVAFDRVATASVAGEVAGPTGLLDELVTGALIAEAERLAGDIGEIASVGDLGAVRVRIDTLSRLVDQLATFRD